MSKLTYDRAQEEFLDYCSSVKGFSRNTTLAYKNDLSRASSVFKSKKISSITLNDVSKFIDAPDERSRSAATRARTVATLRSFFLFCEKEYGEQVIDIRELTLPKVPTPPAHALEESEINLLLNSFGTDDVASRDRAVCELLYATGARISEVHDLDTNDIDYEERLIRVFGKGSKERVIPISKIALEAVHQYHHGARVHFLQKRKQSNATNALFLSQRGTRLSRQGLYDIVHKAAKRVGLEKKVWPHVFRHSFATHLLQHGADMRIVQELLGHSSLSTTQRYTAVDTTRLKQLYDRSHPRAQRSKKSK